MKQSIPEELVIYRPNPYVVMYPAEDIQGQFQQVREYSDIPTRWGFSLGVEADRTRPDVVADTWLVGQKAV